MNALSFVDEIIRLLAPRVAGEETNAVALRLMPSDPRFPVLQGDLEYLGGRFQACAVKYDPSQKGRMTRAPAVFSDSRKDVVLTPAHWKATVWVLTGESAVEGLYYARAMYEVLFDSLPSFLSLPRREVLKLAFEAMHWPREKFISYAKYVTAWPLARYMRQKDMPPIPEGFGTNPLVFTGRCKRVLKNRLVSKSQKNLRLFGGILQGVKRGAYPASDAFVHAAMVKHKVALTTVSPPPPLACRRFFCDEHANQLEPFMTAIFRGLKSRARLFEASTSASYESKRSDGGGRNFLRGHDPLDVDGLMRMVETRPGRVQEMRGEFSPTFLDALEQAEASDTRVMVSAVLEPLKVRLITKGSAARQWVAKFFQKDLWSHLFKYPQFTLTGVPLNGSHLEEILMQEKKLGLDQEFDQWVSGDYSAATDGLKLDATKMFFEEALRLQDFGLDPLMAFRVSEVLRSVLYEQEIHYPKKYRDRGGLEPAMQTNGQLMGSVLSFPILCAINVVCYWNSLLKYLHIHGPPKYRGVKMETLMKMIPLRSLPVKVNGDDILFRSNVVHYVYWKQEVARVGFTLSLGKNYIHPTILTVNSQLYEYNRETGYFRKADYLNAGLLTGQSKITGRDTAKAAPVWDLYNEVVGGAANPERAHRRFVHYHLSTIKDITRGGLLNLSSPTLLGGWGFEIPESCLRVTKRQVALSAFLKKRAIASISRGEEPRALNGLVLDTPSVGLTLHRYHPLVPWPRTLPLPRDLRLLREKIILPHVLETPHYTVTTDDVSYRILPQRVLNELQKTIWDVRSSRLRSWEFELCERFDPLWEPRSDWDEEFFDGFIPDDILPTL
jgi:hypothetical protein